MRPILTRFAQMLFVLWVVATLLFFMFRLMPGDPSAAYIDSTFTDEQIAQLRRTFGLDRPLHEQYAIYLQLLGGIWIIQTLPSVLLGAFTRWFNDWALLAGWAVGISTGTAMAAAANLTPTYPLHLAGFTFPCYTALATVILNLVVVIVLTPVFNAIAARPIPSDETVASDYYA